MDSRLENRYLELINRNRCGALYLGLKTYETELGDPSLAYADETIYIATNLRQDFSLEHAKASDFHHKLDCTLAIRHIDQVCNELSRECDGVRDFCRKPDAGTNIGDPLFKLMAHDSRPDSVRLKVITQRLTQTESYLKKLLARTQLPFARWVSIELDQLKGMPSMFESISAWAKEIGFEDSMLLESAIEHAQTAIVNYCHKLKDIPQSQQLFLGETALQDILDTKAIPFSPKQLQEISRNFLTTTRAEIEELGKQLQRKYSQTHNMDAAQLHQFLVDEFPVDPGENYQGILQAYIDEHHKLEQFAKVTGLFPIPEQQNIKIIQTPKFLEATIPAGAMSAPPPFEQGIKESLVFLTLKPELLAEHTHIGIPTMMLHEGIPGHHLQLATAAMHHSKIRASFQANEHAEGWTTYLEDYVLDQDYCGDLTLEVRFLAKREICRIAARVAIDLYFVSGNREYLNIGVDIKEQSSDPFLLAGELLQTVTGFTSARTQAELNWYSTERGYPLSYLTGNHMTWQLKKDMQSKKCDLSEKEQDILFHTTYLESGNMPLSYLRDVFAEKGLI